MIALGINAVFHDPAAAIVVDGRVVAAAEEERFSRRKHGKPAVPFAVWELPLAAIRQVLCAAGVGPDRVDVVAYSYDPSLVVTGKNGIVSDDWEGLRTLYVERVGRFLRAAFPGIERAELRYVPHHLAHAASAYLVSGVPDSSVMVVDGRGERSSFLAGRVRDGDFTPLIEQRLPHSLGLLYESLTEHLGFRRGHDEYKVMALAAYGRPRFANALTAAVRSVEGRGFVTDAVPWEEFASSLGPGDPWDESHADLAASVQRRLEEVLCELATALHERTDDETLLLAGGVALNCVANSRLFRDGPFRHVWVQPAANDAGTALGAAAYVAHERGDGVRRMTTAALGREFGDDEIERVLRRARVRFERPADLAATAAAALANDQIVGWFQGRSEFGPRALGHRSLLADPRSAGNLERLNAIKGREQFRPLAPIVLAESAAGIFSGGPLPSPFMVFTHRVAPEWHDRIPAVVHVDGTARVQTVEEQGEPLLAAVLRAFERRTGVPVLVNTSFNTAGRPMVDTPRDALECFGSAPIDTLVLGRHVVRRTDFAAPPAAPPGEQ